MNTVHLAFSTIFIVFSIARLQSNLFNNEEDDDTIREPEAKRDYVKRVRRRSTPQPPIADSEKTPKRIQPIIPLIKREPDIICLSDSD